MRIYRKDIELMTPAGSMESLMAGIQGGTDAIYFGIGQLNMRARSSANFTIHDLPEIARIATEHGIKAYLTLNTILYDEDMHEACEIIDAVKENNLSAVIVSDQAILDYARKQGVEVHLSTQLNISNSESLNFYARWADVAVLARELNIDQIRKIYDTIEEKNILGPSGKKIRLELFAHGALCMAISGKCYLSLHEFNHSANRGECFQACRRGYEVTDLETGAKLDIENKYIMSPKDLCTIHFLDRIIYSGIRVLKIEGRARSAEYVKTVASCYNEALHSLEDGTYSPERIEEWRKKLATVFNRGFWDGYYLGQRLGEWSPVYGSLATRRKEMIGKVTNYFQKIGVAEVLIESGDLHPGEEVLITGPTSGVVETVVAELRDDKGIVDFAGKQMLVAFKVPLPVRRADKLYKWVERSSNG
ncbi:MAG: peptidase U32 family protein [Bacteroidales bacterium]